MKALRRFVRRLTASVLGHHDDDRVREELAEHLSLLTEEYVRAGLPLDEAHRRARLTLGAHVPITEAYEDQRRLRGLEDFWQDLRYACRVLRKSPGFATAITLSLALGIGANTAIFTLLEAVMWRMLPVDHPESLLVVGRQRGDDLQTGFTYAEFRLMRESSATTSLAGYATVPISISVDGPPEPSVQAQLVTGDYFSLLGVEPLWGRALGPDDDRVPNAHPVVMLSHGYWERRFGADEQVLGGTLRLAGTPFTIVGVTPPQFFGVEIGTAPDLFVPMMMQPTVMAAFENLLIDPLVSRTWVQTIARTTAGVTADLATAALDALLRAQEEASESADSAATRAKVVLSPATAASSLNRQFSRPLFVLLAMVAVVLLIACANAANLLLARAASRRPEFVMRLALGASRQRLIRQLVVESLLLSTIGGLCGMVLAYWATQALLAYLSSGRTPIVLDVTPNFRILAFTAAVSVLTGLIFGLAPAWRGTKISLSPALRNARELLTRGARPGRTLVVAQLTLSLLLLAVASLFVRSLWALSAGNATINRQTVLTLRVEPRGSDQRGIPGTAERLDQTYKELLRRTSEIRGVEMASLANSAPTAPTSSAAVPIRAAAGNIVRVPALMVYPNYFRTIGIPIVAGRDFGAADLGELAPAVCIVNESFVRQFLPAEDPIGKACYRGRRARLLSSDAPGDTPLPEEAFVIVGVAKDSRYGNPRGAVQPLIYRTFLQSNTGRGQMVLHVRVTGNRGEVVQRIREQVVSIDPTMPVFNVRTLEEEMNAALVQQRLVAMLSTFFGALALVLAAVGLYGLLAFAVVQRRSEMGIRMALGAGRRSLLWLVLSEALLLIAMGSAIGIPAALGLARIASEAVPGLVFGVEATDPVSIAVATIALASVALVAGYVPAWRASRADPLAALRCE